VLGPKVSVVIDSGSALHLDAMPADIRLRADAGWHVAVGGDGSTAIRLGSVAPANATEVVERLLETMALDGPRARAKDIVRRQGPGSFCAAIRDLLNDAPGPRPRLESDPIGTHGLRDGVALGIGLAFGHTDADTLDALIEAAVSSGARGLRTAPGRALLVIGLAANSAPELAAAAASLGFITRRDDPRRHVVACAGAPICASAEIPARRLGPLIGAAAPALLDGSLTVHLSGCPKGCAHPAAGALTIVGRPDSCGLVIGGTARDQASTTIATAALPKTFARLAQEVAPGEKAADMLARLGPARIATILGAAHHG
jgi:precorrin-3B synthase